jgi:hypothetical protein
MAALTFTATTLPDQPRVLSDGGPVIQTAKYVATATLSASDVIQMIRLPEGARVIDGYLSGKVGGTTSLLVKVGLVAASATDGNLISAITLSGTTKLTRFDGGSGLPVASPAILAATYPKYNWLVLTGVSGSFTGSVSVQVTVIYDLGLT